MNRLRNKLVVDQVLSTTISDRFAKRLNKYDSVSEGNVCESWAQKESSVKNLVSKFGQHISQGLSI